MRRNVRLALMFASLVILPTVASAQASVTGVARDTSGAVLPGVTVEAASPALIERVRSGVTDATGQYRIENLRPGIYTLTFSLPGFATVKRDGLELTGTATTSVNAELRVGAVEETITVTGETPIVDVQNTMRQRLMNQEILDILPASRAVPFLVGLTPGVTMSVQDVGGLLGDGVGTGSITVRGVSDARMLIDGVSNHTGVRTSFGAFNIMAYQEVAVTTGGVDAEQREGGVRSNLIPREGGNTFHGIIFGAFANKSLQGNNYTQDLKDRGLATPNSLNRLVDINPAFGGPIKQDKVWFHATVRYNSALNYAPIFFNKNAGNPNAWTYEPDTGRASNENIVKNFNARVTWQATPKNKFSVTYDPTHACDCPRGLSATVSPEANLSSHVTNIPQRQLSAQWTAPLTNRLLIETNIIKHWSTFTRPDENVYFDSPVKLNSVLEQTTGLTYRATATASNLEIWTLFARATVTYTTGAHVFKVGFLPAFAYKLSSTHSIDAPMSFRFNNGVPNQLTLFAVPFESPANEDADHGLFVQDRWTARRFTFTGGLRYDEFRLSFPEQGVGPTAFTPTRNISFPATEGVKWHDISPRGSMAFDVFGDGKTALKISAGRYLGGEFVNLTTFSDNLSAVDRLISSTTRSWTDRNGDFVPDCDLVSTGANGECGAMADPNFGSVRPGVTFDPDTLSGWNKRRYNWQFSGGIQREILPRVSVDFGVWKTVWGNFLVTQNRALSPSDYDVFSITAPVDPRLPGGGGYVVPGLYDLKPAAFGRSADNYVTFAKNFGKQTDHWNGVDVGFTARPRTGVVLQGGTTTQRQTTDNCAVVTYGGTPPVSGSAAVAYNPSQLYCHVSGAFLTQFKLVGSFTVPRIDVQMSASIQSLPGPQILASYTATNAVVSPSLGRSLSGGASNVTVNLVSPLTMYGERLNQLDLRFGKILRFGRMRATANFDLYNALNSSAVLTQSNAFATWQRPLSILNARFAKISAQFNF